MTVARRKLVDPAITRWYHWISRCVRRAFLLEGKDGATDRKAWLHERLKQLSDVFAVAIAGFAILDNHLHVLARLDPHLVDGWSDEEVARRWGRLYPPRKRRNLVPLTPEWIKKRAGDPEWVAKTRDRLKSLSWFMKLLKEPLARLANREDECDGAFFASRFKSIGILDETALLEVCAYIDLNPLAAGITFLPEQSPHASVKDRVQHAWPRLTQEDFEAALHGLTADHLSSGNVEQSLWLCPLEDRCGPGGTREGMLPGLSLPKYLLLLDYTSRVARAGKANLSAEVAPIFERLGTTAEKWT